MRTEIVHDWLVTRAGAERCLEAISAAFPSPIHTLVYRRETLAAMGLADAEVRASFLQRFPAAASCYRNYLPFYPRAAESLDLSAAELILSSSHAAAKGVRKRADQLHISYCYTPMRYAWDLRDQYMAGLDPLRRAAAALVLARIREWDRATAARVDHFIAISEHVADRIRRVYGREAKVIYPPVDTGSIRVSPVKEDYFITVSRLVPYKRVDLIAEAFSAIGLPLYVVGEGPERRKVAAKAFGNVRLLGAPSDSEVRRLVSRARAFVFAAEEDFGIAPVEAMAAGTPVIGFGRGALLETVADGEHGVLFREQSVPSLADAVARFERLERQFDPGALRRNAERFSRQRFDREFKEFVLEKWGEFRGRLPVAPSPGLRPPSPASGRGQGEGAEVLAAL